MQFGLHAGLVGANEASGVQDLSNNEDALVRLSFGYGVGPVGIEGAGADGLRPVGWTRLDGFWTGRLNPWGPKLVAGFCL